jgi:predicted 3-demethylubiquinone-9 3-methyltransferase (glyoxalase superfamily)
VRAGNAEEGPQPLQTITPFLWFDTQAEEAMRFYTSVFQDSKALGVFRYPEGSPVRAGSVMSVTFELNGQRFHGLNGGPMFKFNEAISLLVNCDTQQELDYLWERLSEGGEEQMCGWLKDKFGLSWQVVPSALGRMLGDSDTVKAGRVAQAMLKMRKIDIAALERAFDGRAG